MKDDDEFIERRIVTGLIVSVEYAQEVEPIWKKEYIESRAAQLISGWCLDYFRAYKRAPREDIEGIYTSHLKELPQSQAEDIEEILSGLSEEFSRGVFNVQYLLDQTKSYFKERELRLFSDKIQRALDSGDLTEAEHLALTFNPSAEELTEVIDPLGSAQIIKRAFTESVEPIIRFPKALGEFWNDSFCRDSFVALMAPEKRGKSFWLMELTIRAVMSGCNVVMFQAGDMSMEQWIRRVCIYLAGRSDKIKYCTPRWVPVLDCWRNQTDCCDQEEREGSFGIFPQGTDQKTLTYKTLVDRAECYPEYKPCHNCPHIQGAVWMQWQEALKPLNWKDAVRISKQWRDKHEKQMRLATYPNETLTISEIRAKLEVLERKEGYIPDVIIVDYVDIMAPDPDCSRLDKLEQTNRIWQRLRRLSQEKHCLVITATQAAATAYDKESMTLKDFSDNKKKYAHVTATYALNQTDEEKKLGVMRIGKMVIREDEFDRREQIHVLQHLHKGRPFVGSFFPN